MKREDLDKAINAIDEEQRELENKISALKAKKMELQRQYVCEYPNKVKEGSKIRIKSKWGRTEREYIGFVVCHAFKCSLYGNYDYFCLYEDKNVGAKLHKVKKDGTPSERVERVWGDIVEFEVLEPAKS